MGRCILGTRSLAVRKTQPHRVWTIAEAKACLSEILQLAESEGPQRIGVRKAFVVVPAHVWDKKLSLRKPLGQWLIERMPRGTALELPDRNSHPARSRSAVMKTNEQSPPGHPHGGVAGQQSGAEMTRVCEGPERPSPALTAGSGTGPPATGVRAAGRGTDRRWYSPTQPESNPVKRFFQALCRALEGHVYASLAAKQKVLKTVLQIRPGCAACAAGTGSGRF